MLRSSHSARDSSVALVHKRKLNADGPLELSYTTATAAERTRRHTCTQGALLYFRVGRMDSLTVSWKF